MGRLRVLEASCGVSWGEIIINRLRTGPPDNLEPELSRTILLAIGTNICFLIVLTTIHLNLPFRWHGPDNLRLMANNSRRDIENEGEWKPNTVKSELQALIRHDCFSMSFGFLIKYFSCVLLFVISMQNIKVN